MIQIPDLSDVGWVSRHIKNWKVSCFRISDIKYNLSDGKSQSLLSTLPAPCLNNQLWELFNSSNRITTFIYKVADWYQSCHKIMNYPDTILNIPGSLNLLHKVNRKENNLDYWYVCLVECRVNHNHLSIIRSEYIIMISCSFVDVHPAICIYQQSINYEPF